MNLIDFKIPEKTNINGIYYEAMVSYLGTEYGIIMPEDVMEGMWGLLNHATELERGRWLGAVLRAKEDKYAFHT